MVPHPWQNNAIAGMPVDARLIGISKEMRAALDSVKAEAVRLWDTRA